MALSMRALANRHCSSRAVSMRARCPASSFSGSSFLRGAISSRSAPADHFPAPASSVVVVPALLLLRLRLAGSQGPLAAAPAGSGKHRRGGIGSACASAVDAAPALPLFSLLLSVRRGGGASALGGAFLWAKEAALRRERVKLAADVDSGIARMPS